MIRFGTSGNTILLLAGNDRHIAGNGDDILYGDDGNDTLGGGNGNDRLSQLYGNATLFGDAGDGLIGSSNGWGTISAPSMLDIYGYTVRPTITIDSFFTKGLTSISTVGL